jgi:hypothetical protein
VDQNQLGITAYVNVPHMFDWHLSLLEGAPTKDMMDPKVTSISTSCALFINNPQAEMYNLSGEPTVGALSTADTQCLHNQNGYMTVIWMRTRAQMRCTLTLLGDLYGMEHPIPTGWRSMLRQYHRVEARLQHEIDTEV